ncbi:MAG: AIPR family protein [Chitinispirillaceae bacterium]|nr:AIPR family protein [Chitinispirillaceae bacterium]
MGEMEKNSRKLYLELKDTLGGTRDHYLALAYLMREFVLEKNDAVSRVAFSSSDYGINAYHFDAVRKNLYLFIITASSLTDQIKQPLRQFVTNGLEKIFATEKSISEGDRFYNSLAACLLENSVLVDQIYFRIIMSGDPGELEQSEYVNNLIEQLEQKKYLIDRFFNGRSIRFSHDRRSIDDNTVKTGTTSRAYEYDLELDQVLQQVGPADERMIIAFMRIVDLLAMYRDMGSRFFERNIRYGLGDSGYVNKSITNSFNKIILKEKESPGVFAFNHNGVTIAAQEVQCSGNRCHIVSPRLLNGAQTVTTFNTFCTVNNISEGNPEYDRYRHTVEDIRLLCKFITEATPDFITSVTINNNRQNPVAPWDLHANDEIQLQLQDKFRTELGIYYERQKNAFKDIDPDTEEGITQKKETKLLKLAQTFLASDGELELLGSVRDAFEEDEIYEKVFNPSRLKADFHSIVLCYKIQFRLNRLIKEIVDKGPAKYWYLKKARNLLWTLLCQAILNDGKLEELALNYGADMVMSKGFTDYLADISSRRCRQLIAALEEKNRDKIEAGEVTFLNKNRAFTFCMSEAVEKWGWRKKGLR